MSGKVHADPTSFIISEKNLGAYLIFFEPTWKEGSAGTSVADLVSLKPNAPFSKLGVSGDATFEGAISFHGIKLTYDSTNKAIKIDGNLYATGGITAYGAGASTTGGGGGLNGSVKSYSNALKLTSESLSEIASAYSIKALDSRISSLEGGSAMDVSVSGSGNAVTAISKSGTTIIVTKGTTFLTSHQSLASYLTRTDAASLYQPKGNYLTAHQSLDGYVNEVATSGTGNAITSVSKSGKKLTFTKGATFLTSHQSLANYVTINDSRLSDSRYPKFANNTWYLVGDDAYMGDCNVMGMIGVKSANAATPGFALYNNSGTLLGRLYASKGTLVWDGGTIQTTNFSGNASSATTSSMLKTADLKGAMYVPSDTHYMCLGYMDCTGSYDSLTLLVTSAFWGNQHGSQDIITIQQSNNTNDTARIQTTVGRLRLGGSTERTFYYYKDNSSFRLYLYVYVTGGNSYGRWNISYLGGNATWVTAHQENVTKSSSWITIGYSAQVNYASNADMVDYCHVARWNGLPFVNVAGVMEIGKFIDFHNAKEDSTDYSTRIECTGVHNNIIKLPSASGTLALTSDNVASATKLATARTIWGQSFDGTGNVNGTIYINNSDSENGAIILNNNVNTHARISAIKDQVVFHTGAAIRFGATNWEYSDWAGLKYDTVANAIYLGIADGTVFNYHSNKRSNGTLKFPGITTITPDSGARIGGSGGDLYLGNGNNTNWVKVQDMCSQVDSNNWKIMQGGYALFKDITIINTATINGSTHINNLLTAKGIMPTTADVNAFGTNVNNWDGSIAANVTNMFNGIPQENIQVEYSMDNGDTWNHIW